MSDINSRLKYFYLINVDAIVKKLKETPAYLKFIQNLNASADELFLAIFKEIIHVAQPYCGFILSENHVTPPSIFNEPSDICFNQIQTRSLCEISLFHHCIVSSFMEHIKKSPFVTKRSGHSITLSGPHEDEIKRGYFCHADLAEVIETDTVNNTYADNDPECDNKSQKFYSRYKEFAAKNDSQNNGIPYYSKQILSSNSSTVIKSARNTLTVDRWISNPCLFLFADPAVKIFDKELCNSKSPANSLLDKYLKLKSHSTQWRNALFFDTDRILFDYFIEKHYHFSTYEYMENLLLDIDDPSSTISKINGTTFMKLAERFIYKLPLTYNRCIFLMYAINALTNNTCLCSTFPRDPNHRHSFDGYMSDDKYAITALDLLGDYLRALNHIAIPLVMDLWNALTDTLNLDFSHYENFILKHFDTIAFDYTRGIPYAEKQSTSEAKSFSSEYHALEKSIQKILTSPEDKMQKEISEKNASSLFHAQLLRHVFSSSTNHEYDLLSIFANPYISNSPNHSDCSNFNEFIFHHSSALYNLAKKLP